MAAADIERAAHRAALKVKKMLIDMLAENRVGSVTVEVTFAGLQPIKRIDEREPVIRVSRGVATPIETVT